MSKIGRKPIDITNVKIELNGREIRYNGPKKSGIHILPEILDAQINDNKIMLVPKASALKQMKQRDINCVWGLNRALLANEIQGAKQEFEKIIEIIGLGFKVVGSGNKIVFSLGYTHKIDFELPAGVSWSADKTGQKLTLRSSNKEALGQTASAICDFRLPEPYKGTGIKLADQEIIRKAGKTK